MFRVDSSVQPVIPTAATVIRTASANRITVFMSVSLGIRDPHRT
jgi:hypothetical protein